MPSRRDGAGAGRESADARGGGQRDEYSLDGDDADEEEHREQGATGKPYGVTLGKRSGGPVLGGSEVKKQTQVTSLFALVHKKQQAARLIPAGMVNLGNTCYLNSVVQVLLNMPTFASDLRDPALEHLRQHLPVMGVWAALRATSNKLRTASLARPTTDSLKPAVEPSELRTSMGRRSSRWRGFAQQDAHEFLVELLEGLQNEVLAAEAAATGLRRMPLSATRCPSARNLSGCMMHTWTCSACGRCTRAKEPFSCLSLQLPAQGSVKLQDMVAEYLKEETIDKNCDGCSPSAPVPHTAQHHLWRLPRVLVVHIKRFMPLPQAQQPAQQAHQSQQQGPGGTDAAGPIAAAGMLAADEPEAAAQADDVSIPGTPHQADASQHQQMGVERLARSAPQAASAPASREATPPAPYLYAKVHTVVEVASALDVARHCDGAAQAHGHLLEGVPVAALTRRAVGDDAAAAAGGALAGAHLSGYTGGGGGGSAAARTPAPVTTAGRTLDTAGGGSTCPSPSFLQPNRSALQERTVQQLGQLPPAQQQRSRLGLVKAAGGINRPLESECGTSAMSTGAQADGGGGAGTPYGGVAPPASRRDQEQGYQRLGTDGVKTVSVSRDGSAGGSGGLACGPGNVFVDVATPLALLRPAGKGLGNGGSQPTPSGRPTGRRQSTHTGNDVSALLPPPGSTCRGGGGGGGSVAPEAGPDGAAYSERKAPKAIATGSFFGGGGTEPLSGNGAYLGGSRSNGGGEGLVRPQKRICMEDRTAPLSDRQISEAHPTQAAAVPWHLEDMTEEEQLQLALKMSLAEEDGPTGASSGGGGSSGMLDGQRSDAAVGDSVRAGAGGPVLDLSEPTGAARRGSGLGSGAAAQPSRRVSASGDSAAAGDGAAGPVSQQQRSRDCVGGSGEDKEGEREEELVLELQDESQGGGERRHYGARPAGSGPGISGASGSREQGDNDGDDGSDSSADEGCHAGAGGRGATHNRRHVVHVLNRRRKRRIASCPNAGIPAVAESPALPPPQRRRVRDGSADVDVDLDDGVDVDRGGGVNNADRAACYVDGDEDGTTALSPVSGGAQRPGTASGGGGRTGPGLPPEAAGPIGAPRGAGEDVYMAPADEDQEMEEVLRLSMETFAAEEAGRKMRDSCGGGGVFESDTVVFVQAADGGGRRGGGAGTARKSRAEEEWERVLKIPDVDQAIEAAAAAAAAAAACCTPPHSGGAPLGDDAVAPPPSPMHRRPGPEVRSGRRAAAAGGGADAGGRGAGIDALVVAAGLGIGGNGASAAAPNPQASVDFPMATTARRIPSALRGNNADADNLLGTTEREQGGFKFGFSLQDDGGGAGAAVAGTRHEEPLDLTGDGGGGDDDDVDLNKAIMLSLQEANVPEKAWMMSLTDDVTDTVVDLNAADAAADGDAAEPAAPRPKVILVPDSDAEDDAEDDDATEAITDEGSLPSGTARARTPRAVKAHQKGRAEATGVPLSQLARYRLQGVVRHKGLTPFSGHYVADVLVATPNGQMWYEHNDSVVSHVDFARVREDAAKQGYLFFFVNEATRAAVSAAVVVAAAAVPLPEGGAAKVA